MEHLVFAAKKFLVLWILITLMSSCSSNGLCMKKHAVDAFWIFGTGVPSVILKGTLFKDAVQN